MIDEELVETLACIRDEYCAKYTAYDSWSKHCMSSCPFNEKGSCIIGLAASILYEELLNRKEIKNETNS